MTAVVKPVDNFQIINSRSMKEARLSNMKSFLATEKASEKPSKVYMDDLKGCIKQLEQQLAIEVKA